VPEDVLKHFTRFVFAVCAIGALTGCQKSSVIGIPPPPPPRMFVSDSNFGGLGTFSVSIFTPPLTPLSVPAVTLGAANGLVAEPSGSAFDSKGNFYVIDDASSSIYIYAPPVTATSMPTTVIGPQPGFSNAFSLALDASGDIWVSSSGNSFIYEFTPPFATGVAVPAISMHATTPALSGNAGIIFDKLGRMFVANQFTSQVLVFNPPFTAASVAIAAITTPGINPEGLTVDLKDDLVVAEFNSGNLDVYNPPYATGISPAFVIAPPVVSGAPSSETYQPVFGPDGNLYVPYQLDGATGNVSIFAQPLSGASSPILSLPGAGQPSAVSFGP
jgi:streptogramin lyase